MAMTIVEGTRAITGGVDTHLEVHVAAALDPVGGLLGVKEFCTSREGERELLAWLSGFGSVERVGVEGTGSYGASLGRFLSGAGVQVVEVDRPNRQARHRQGKSDPVDAVEAARAALGGRAAGAAKGRDGNVEAIRALMVAKRSARSVRIKTINQIRHLSFTAPEEIRARYKDISSRQGIATQVAVLRPRPGGDPVVFATKIAMRTLGRRVLALDEEKVALDTLLTELVTATAPELLALAGVGIDTAALLLVAAGDNAQRIRNEAAWAHFCGVAPIEASSGKTVRHRLNRGGDRQANHALWRIVITRMSSDPRTKTYVARRLAEGRTKSEIIRVLKRYVAREVFKHLPRD
jgi:transposase